MEALLNNFFANPLYYIGGFLAVCAACSVVLFISGFGPGAKQMFTVDGHEGHLAHQRLRAVWGIYLLATIFAVWEIVRFVFEFQLMKALLVALVYAAVVLVLYVIYKLSKRLQAAG